MTIAALITRSLAVSAVLTLTAGAALAADRPAPFIPLTPVAPGIPAHVELGVGFTSDGGTQGAMEGAGRIVLPWSAPWKVEIEAAGQARFWDSDDATTLFGGYAHFYHAMQNGMAGVLVGLQSNFRPVGVLGVEARWNVSPTSVAQVQLLGLFQNSGTGVQLRGEWWHYVSPDHKWGVFGDVQDFACCTTSWEVGLAGEKRLSGMPMSIYGRASYATFYGSSGFIGMIGARFFTDGPTLRQSDDNVPWATRLHFAALD